MYLIDEIQYYCRMVESFFLFTYALFFLLIIGIHRMNTTIYEPNIIDHASHYLEKIILRYSNNNDCG